MLTQPRLSVFQADGLLGTVKHGVFKRVFGAVPAAVAVLEPKTRLDRRGFMGLYMLLLRDRGGWTRPELELFSSFTSSVNHCRF